jgi:wyosine [tRNA(Phe)-imidazoG37] synthetase (radical SAM superfamily)
MIAFGPVPSRRLGQSLGINNIPPKNCSYDCVYCQVGPTAQKDLQRRPFFEPDEIFQAVIQKVQEVRDASGRIDYLTLVPDGEPTLDIHLGKTIEMLRPLKIKIAVITNSSLLWLEEVRNELALADYVSLKMDSVNENTWRKINRPNPKLSLPEILAGALTFSKIFKGTLVSETMLVRGINDHEASLEATAEYLGQLNLAIAYIAIPTRPPSERWVQTPDEETLNLAYHIFRNHVVRTEYLTGFSEDAFSATGDVVQNLVNITSVHPMRESEALEFLKQGNADGKKLEELVAQEKLVRIIHRGLPFYVRKLPLVKSGD